MIIVNHFYLYLLKWKYYAFRPTKQHFFFISFSTESKMHTWISRDVELGWKKKYAHVTLSRSVERLKIPLPLRSFCINLKIVISRIWKIIEVQKSFRFRSGYFQFGDQALKSQGEYLTLCIDYIVQAPFKIRMIPRPKMLPYSLLVWRK